MVSVEGYEVGDIRRGTDLGYKIPILMIVDACIDCGKLRWIPKKPSHPHQHRCKMCARRGPQHPRWKGGIIHAGGGYNAVYLREEDRFFTPMVFRGHYVLEHRLVMAKHLGRCLLPWEIVHHRNGNKVDNRISNLQLLPSRKIHLSDSLAKTYAKRQGKRIAQLEERVTILEAENTALRKQVEVRSVIC